MSEEVNEIVLNYGDVKTIRTELERAQRMREALVLVEKKLGDGQPSNDGVYDAVRQALSDGGEK